MHFTTASLASLLATWPALVAGRDDFHDVTSFVTRPEIRSPKWDIKYYDRDAVAPGHWMVALYAKDANRIRDCGVGPMVYDADGELVWSGACRFNNRESWDWGETKIGDEYFLKGAIIGMDGVPLTGYFLGSDYTIEKQVVAQGNWDDLDPHEFNVLPDEKHALVVTAHQRMVDAESLGFPGHDMFVKGSSVREIDVDTGATTWEWMVDRHVFLNETTNKLDPDSGLPRASRDKDLLDVNRPKSSGQDIFGFGHKHWYDAFHINAADRSGAFYIVSLRYTDTLYLVSRESKEIMWRLGGRMSDFEQEGNFTFSRQHNVRFVSHDEDRTVLSFHDNAASGIDEEYAFFNQEPTSKNSRGLIVECLHPNGKPTKARILHKYDCPNGCLAHKRGDVQRLENGNVLVGWTIDQGHFSEHAEDGTALLEAQFQSDRTDTYRIYKLEHFVGRPTGRPDVKAVINSFDAGNDGAAMTVWVSWMGTTETAYWNFYDSDGDLFGTKNKTGFETTFITTHVPNGKITVAAMDKNGTVLSKTKPFTPENPENYEFESYKAIDSGSGSSESTTTTGGNNDSTDVVGDVSDNTVVEEEKFTEPEHTTAEESEGEKLDDSAAEEAEDKSDKSGHDFGLLEFIGLAVVIVAIGTGLFFLVRWWQRRQRRARNAMMNGGQQTSSKGYEHVPLADDDAA